MRQGSEDVDKGRVSGDMRVPRGSDNDRIPSQSKPPRVGLLEKSATQRIRRRSLNTRVIKLSKVRSNNDQKVQERSARSDNLLYNNNTEEEGCANQVEEHSWEFLTMFGSETVEACSKCGVVRRKDDMNGPCKGQKRVTLRRI